MTGTALISWRPPLAGSPKAVVAGASETSRSGGLRPIVPPMSSSGDGMSGEAVAGKERDVASETEKAIAEVELRDQTSTRPCSPPVALQRLTESQRSHLDPQQNHLGYQCMKRMDS